MKGLTHPHQGLGEQPGLPSSAKQQQSGNHPDLRKNFVPGVATEKAHFWGLDRWHCFQLKKPRRHQPCRIECAVIKITKEISEPSNNCSHRIRKQQPMLEYWHWFHWTIYMMPGHGEKNNPKVPANVSICITFMLNAELVPYYSPRLIICSLFWPWYHWLICQTCLLKQREIVPLFLQRKPKEPALLSDWLITAAFACGCASFLLQALIL